MKLNKFILPIFFSLALTCSAETEEQIVQNAAKLARIIEAENQAARDYEYKARLKRESKDTYPIFGTILFGGILLFGACLISAHNHNK